MKLDDQTQFQYFEIWAPRYSTKDVLLAKYKVGNHNKIVFTRAPSMGTEPYYISGETAKLCKTESNGKIDCLVIPLSKLEPLEML